MYLPNLNAFFDGDSTSGTASLGVVTSNANITWTTAASLTNYIRLAGVPQRYDGGCGSPLGDVWGFVNDPTGTLLAGIMAMKVTGSVVTPITTTPRLVQTYGIPTGSVDAGVNLARTNLFQYPWCVTDSTGTGTVYFQYVVNPYVNPTAIASPTALLKVFTAADTLSALRVNLLNYQPGDSFTWVTSPYTLPPGMSTETNLVLLNNVRVLQLIFASSASVTTANYLTALKAIRYTTTSPSQVPRSFEVIATSVDGIDAIRPAQTIVYF
jgi:hypothetical protein